MTDLDGAGREAAAEPPRRPGRLKVFLGAAPGGGRHPTPEGLHRRMAHGNIHPAERSPPRTPPAEA